ncbi:unnamed protein product [Anisakis simplex]|uniref:Cystatin domain-containing protein n=1 Tax=Anisakis simplex TaxID=6269 RepID=A0A0M3J7E2_ANISI|nr:unnamed protein product [Anisakis simplex]
MKGSHGKAEIPIWLLLLLSFAIINKSSEFATYHTRSADYKVFRAKAPVTAYNERMAMMDSLDFNPLLLGGSRQYPGIRVRANAAMFRYASVKAANILTQQIARAQIPDINLCLEEVGGCVKVYGIRVARYQCPQYVSINPFPNDRLRISVQNLTVKWI